MSYLWERAGQWEEGGRESRVVKHLTGTKVKSLSVDDNAYDNIFGWPNIQCIHAGNK